jgi:hypothetical protein
MRLAGVGGGGAAVPGVCTTVVVAAVGVLSAAGPLVAWLLTRSLTSWGVEEDFTELGEMGEAAAVCVDGETRAGGRIWLCCIGCVAVAPAGLAVLP